MKVVKGKLMGPISKRDLDLLAKNPKKFWKGVTEIGKNAFNNCSSLTSITIPEGVTEIGKNAFNNCSSLTSITIPKSVTEIGWNAFNNCSSLTSVIIPDSVTAIGVSAFLDCSSLTSINIPEGVTVIGVGAFMGCHSLTSINIPNSVTAIGVSAFLDCSSLTSITIPEGVTVIGVGAFMGCHSLTSITIPEGVTEIGEYAFEGFSYIYLDKNSGELILTKDKKKDFFNSYFEQEFTQENLTKFANKNFRTNLLQLHAWKEQRKIKFIPPEYTMEIFPSSQMEKYFINNNNQRWGELVKTLKFDTLEEPDKNNSLVDLMKIYYEIGGFSENQGESEKAFEYILNHVAKTENPNATPSEIGAEIHIRFSKITLKNEYNPTFAQFFMKYYHDNPDFMVFSLKDEDGDLMEEQDYLCMANNAFGAILKNYPNRVVNGNEERALLTPRFVAEHSSMVEYDDVLKGNETLARIVGRYGYSQEQFIHIQKVYEQAKKIKEKYVISADKSSGEKGITFRVLEKDDPLGFVLGDITNCCQHIGGAGEACVDDGYKNPNAGFLVFEEAILDKEGKPIGKTRILAQAYVWYDPKTKTVCYDNIEIPTKILNELKKGEKHNRKTSTSALMDAVLKSANAIMHEMNKNGVEVERVTTGVGYNDLITELEKEFGKPEKNPIAKHRGYSGYTDAKHGQFLISTYDQATKIYAARARKALSEASSDLTAIEEELKRPKME